MQNRGLFAKLFPRVTFPVYGMARLCYNKQFNAIVTSIPELKDLYQHITPQYAADWEVIGTLLGLPSGELKAIEAGYPTNVKWCCNQMLKKWLEVDPTASWGTLFAVIESPAVSSGQVVDKGDFLLFLRSRLWYWASVTKNYSYGNRLTVQVCTTVKS